MLNKNNFWNILVTVKIYALTLLIFTCFRLFLFIIEFDRIDETTSVYTIISAFIMGIRFDIVICGYILAIPFLLLTLDFLYFKSKTLKSILFYFVFILFFIAFGISAADIPYFSQFFSRFSVGAFEWADSPVFVSKMILEEPRYWLYIIPFVVTIVLFYIALKKIIFSEMKNVVPARIGLKIIASILFLGLIFIGIRGRIEKKSPIRVGTAYFSNNPFLNQLGLNPNFTLIRSILDLSNDENQTLNLMDEDLAISNVQKYFNITDIDATYPILRMENRSDTTSDFKNVVIIIMESMSAAKMERHGSGENLTPFLDSLSNKGLYFENAYTSGIHTFNGIYSTIFSYPSLYRQHPMKDISMSKYHGIASALKNYDYSTTYFTTHDGQFDNVEGFLRANDFENVFTSKDYPAGVAKTTLGVPDDFLFEFSIPILNDLSKKGKPFLSVYMTASDHGPYHIPKYFKPKSKELKKQIVEYADYSLRKFIELSSKEPWFENTLFVFVADHGAAITAKYDVSLDYNHSPLLFYQPSIIKENKVYNKMAGQIDVFPSIMGLLQIPFQNNTLGINLFKDERPYIYFNVDDKYGVIDQNWLLIVKKDNSLGLYKYVDSDLTNYSTQKPEIVERMRTYAESNLQTSQYLIKKRKTEYPIPYRK